MTTEINQQADTDDESESNSDWRRVLQAGIGAAGLTGLASLASAQQGSQTLIELEAVTVDTSGGRGRSEYAWEDGEGGVARGPPEDVCNIVGGTHVWVGVSPDSIADLTNPTLNLTAGETYTVEWTNTDGEDHNFVIADADGSELFTSETVSDEGGTQSVEFTATEEMATYYCGPHSDSQRGSVEVSVPAGDVTVDSFDPSGVTVSQGDAVDFSATVSNTGDSSVTQVVSLSVNGNQIDSKEVSIDAGAQTTVSFMDVDTSSFPEGDHTVTIASGGSQASGTLTVEVDSEPTPTEYTVQQTGGGTAEEPAFTLEPEGDVFDDVDGDGDPSGPDDLSADVYLGYDADALYLTVEVTDDTHTAISGVDMWQADSVQWAVGSGDTYGPEYGLSLADGSTSLHRWIDGNAQAGTDAVDATTSRSGSTTTYDATVPWEALFAESKAPGDSFPFSVLVNESDDDSRDGVLEWALPAISNDKSVSSLGTLTLAEGSGGGNESPMAAFTASPSSVAPDDTVTFEASGSSDSDGSIESYEWAFGDGSSATGQSVDHSYDSAGEYDVTLTVTDDDGATATNTQTITVEDEEEPPTASFTASSTSVAPGDAVTFDASASSDPDGSIESYEWTFGDGSSATGQSVDHSYDSAGEYDVTLTVTDDDGAPATNTQTITVEDAGPTTTFEFRGAIGGWEGIAPSSIEGDTNPTLTLQEGETYKLGWTEGDGFGHNIAIRDANGNVIDDLATERTTDPGDGEWLTFTATSEMAEYVCEPHQSTMVGNIEVV